MAAIEDHEAALEVAAAAGTRLLELRERLGGGDPRRLGDEGDRLSHAFIVAALAERFPDDPILSEEGSSTAARDGRLWIVDPLDGTREYGEPPRDDWSVHVALVEGGEVRAAAVAVPARGVVHGTGEPPSVPALDRERPLILVSASRPPAFADELAALLGAVLEPMGSAGAKTVAVLDGRADAYVHEGGQYEWDSAAPAGVALAAGLHASRLDGSPLRYGRPDPWLPDLVVCRPELKEPLFQALARLEPWD